MKVLVWQWGRRGAGPRFAGELLRAFAAIPGVDALLSLSERAELLTAADAPECALPVPTYAGMPGFLGRVLRAPFMVRSLSEWLRAQKVDVALCAMPAPLDFIMAAALHRAGVPYAVVVHDADHHPGDRFPMQIRLQRWLLRRAALVFALSTHVAGRLRQQGLTGPRPLQLAALPPFDYGATPPPFTHGGKLRLLSFGRLLPYKGLDLLAESLARLGPHDDMEVRVVGSGPESPELDRLRRLPGVQVENRWVAEDELGGLLGWADALILTHREASQSGVAAAAIAARRWIISTRVGGLAEQLGGQSMAILCDPDPTSITDALHHLLKRPATPAGTTEPRAEWHTVATGMVAALHSLVPER